MIGKKIKNLRTQKKLRQYEVAELMGITQKSICTIEAKDDLHIATLNNYLKALGGQLKITAEFPEEGVSYDLSRYIKED
ncbi:TPA: helix-turn-helix domain-containing protein [Legionella pneumophila]|nr:XRE family transcriptional regulator [Legionella pneumophila]